MLFNRKCNSKKKCNAFWICSSLNIFHVIQKSFELIDLVPVCSYLEGNIFKYRQTTKGGKTNSQRKIFQKTKRERR